MSKVAEDKSGNMSKAHDAVTEAALACAERAKGIFDAGLGDYIEARMMMTAAATALATIGPFVKG